MAEINIAPKYVEVGAGKRIVILDEDEFDKLLDSLELIEAKMILEDEQDTEIDWESATKELIRNRISAIRASKGVTQRALAARLGVRPSTLSRWEKANSNLTLETLRKVAAALECDIHDLIE